MIDYSFLFSVIQIARKAGGEIMRYYADLRSLTIDQKLDQTPVSSADLAAQAIIEEGLLQLAAPIPVISEEQKVPPFALRKDWDLLWLVDPLDGTQGFLQGSGEFTVNIALIKNNKPVLGVIYAPVTGTCYYAAEGQGAFCQPGYQPPKRLRAKPYSGQAVNIAVSKYHLSPAVSRVLEQFAEYHILKVNSSLKFGLIAEGKADIYPRVGPTSEWDTAAGQCIVEAAGGVVVDLQGRSLLYNARPDIVNPDFIALGHPDWLPRIITHLN